MLSHVSLPESEEDGEDRAKVAKTAVCVAVQLHVYFEGCVAGLGELLTAAAASSSAAMPSLADIRTVRTRYYARLADLNWPKRRFLVRSEGAHPAEPQLPYRLPCDGLGPAVASVTDHVPLMAILHENRLAQSLTARTYGECVGSASDWSSIFEPKSNFVVTGVAPSDSPMTPSSSSAGGGDGGHSLVIPQPTGGPSVIPRTILTRFRFLHRRTPIHVVPPVVPTSAGLPVIPPPATGQPFIPPGMPLSALVLRQLFGPPMPQFGGSIGPGGFVPADTVYASIPPDYGGQSPIQRQWGERTAAPSARIAPRTAARVRVVDARGRGAVGVGAEEVPLRRSLLTNVATPMSLDLTLASSEPFSGPSPIDSMRTWMFDFPSSLGTTTSD
uniref:Uncharacterized protein n=1 Tax=Mycena chlorophos TaxID=658473 RepID=A0ABQ0KVG0_MYCCL|nr:predicted protein [Mycena chlorophos]